MMQPKGLAAILFFLFSVMIVGAENAYVESFDSHEYNDTLQTTAQWDTIMGELKLHEFEVSEVGYFGIPTDARALSVSGNYVAVVNYSGNFDMIGVGDLSYPNLFSSNAFGQNLYDVEFIGDFVYIAAGNGGLKIVDVTAANAPVVAGSYNSPGSARGITVRGNHAYLCDGDSGLHVIDVSDPTNPLLLGTYDSPGFAFRVDVAGDLALLADGSAGVRTIDLSDPTGPVLLGVYDTPGTAMSADIEGDRAYVADRSGGLQVIDISNPALPVLEGSYATIDDALSVTVEGDRAYIAAEDAGLLILDVSDPSAPLPLFLHDTPGRVYEIVIEGENAIIADDTSGIRIIKVQKISSIELVGSNDGWLGEDLVFAGNVAFFAADYDGIDVYDVGDPTNPVLIGSNSVIGWALGLDLQGDLLYAAYDLDGVYVFDVSDPADPVQVGHYDDVAFLSALNVEVEGDLAYVSCSYDGMIILDVSDPTIPVFLGQIDPGADVLSIALTWPYAYLCGSSYGISIVDVSDPTNPVEVGHYDTDYYAMDIAIAGGQAWVADYSGDLLVLNITDPIAPLYVTDLPISSAFAYEVEVNGDFAFLANGSGGLAVVDISDQQNPELLLTHSTVGHAYGLDLFGDKVGVFTGTGAFEIFDVYQSEFMLEEAIGQSLNVDNDSEDVIARARLTSTSSTGVNWEISSSDQFNYGPIEPDLSWTRLVQPGADLFWRATLIYDGTTAPEVSNLGLQWLNDFAPITSIGDVPDDQGGRVALRMTRSGYDFVDETEFLIHNYNVWLRVDDILLRESVLSEGRVLEDWGDGASLFRLGDREFLVRGDGQRGSMPPGVWASAGSFPAMQQDEYAFVAETLADSTDAGTHWSVFCVTAHTDSPVVWYASHPDSAYSLDNLAPNVPSGFTVDHDPYGVTNLSWDESEEEDFRYFRVYRGTSVDFEIGSENLMRETIDTAWTDEAGGPSFFYKITALDFAGNESDPAVPDQVVGVDESAPTALALHPNLPNPFNPSTEIRFDLPKSAEVRLAVYDVSGRVVRELASERLEAGVHVYTWKGRDEEGASMASGIYFAVLTAEGRDLRHKMVLLK